MKLNNRVKLNVAIFNVILGRVSVVEVTKWFFSDWFI